MIDKFFHSAVSAWFGATFGSPTPAQSEAWAEITRGRNTLIAAPTGSGKTLAAFMTAIDSLVRDSLNQACGGLPDETRVLYISPLKALSNDIRNNLEAPLQGISEQLMYHHYPAHEIRTAVRTGDTSQSERTAMRAHPPHILVTTPESLFILLTSDSGRRMLGTVRTVIVDEIHALAGNKRGTHLSLSLERLEALTAAPPVRIGLSATQKPVADIARFLVGNREAHCNIVDTGHVRDRDLAIEIPGSPLEAVMSNEIWQEIYDRLETLIHSHRTTLIFVNTRRLAERAARFLAERIGEENVTSHHGSLSREHRFDAEQRLKQGQLKALVATASLELGIDIGDIDLVCQIGSPRSIAAFLQRVGRSGHRIGALPKGRLFPLSRDDLLECSALLRAVNENELDRLSVPEGHLDVLAQQIIAEVSGNEWSENALYRLVTRAWPYRNLGRDTFDEVVAMLVSGFSTRRGRRSRYLHHDAVNGMLRPRRGARLTAVTNGGVIPDMFDYTVVLEPAGHVIGTLNEDFAFESLPGDIFQLGNTSYRILKVEQSKVRVEDAHGLPPNIPFWFGEAPGRSDILSSYVSRLRADAEREIRAGAALESWLEETVGLQPGAAIQLSAYLQATHAALGCIPTQETLVFERFFDEVGDQHLVVHSPYGSRINRAWGLGLRKRFCRQFNFELQAAALDDSIVLSLGATHSFPLEDATRFVKSNSIREVVIQAMLAAPMFATHWRWNATTALALKRNNGGKKVPPTFQRMNAEDLMAVVFPDQLACQENLAGEREVPDHPLVTQTVEDCLNEVMDIQGLTRVLEKLERGEITVRCADLSGPSPLSHEILNARPYAFLDDAPAEERRTQAVVARRFSDPADASELARLDAAAVDQVCREAWPTAASAEECHDALMLLGFISTPESRGVNIAGCDYSRFLGELAAQNRATCLNTGRRYLWVCAERLPLFQVLFPDATADPGIVAAGSAAKLDWSREEALKEVTRARLECLGPATGDDLAGTLGSTAGETTAALLALENEGYAMQGVFRGRGAREWCERGLLARMHRYTIKTLRAEIRPASTAEYMQFLLQWHGFGDNRPEGDDALLAAVERLEGFPVAAAAWESEVLPARISDYSPSSLDRLCGSGRLSWMRHSRNRQQTSEGGGRSGLLRNSPILLTDRRHLDFWRGAAPAAGDTAQLSSSAQKVLDALQRKGASFFTDLVRESGQLRTMVEEALAELAAKGLVTSDNYAGLRALITPSGKRPGFGRRARRRTFSAPAGGIDDAGRWSVIPEPAAAPDKPRGWLSTDEDTLEHIAHVLLKRYGVVFRRVLDRESGLPPWRDLVYVYRRMEARGELRGGRFVDGFGGEQFALPDAVGLLRKQHNRRDTTATLVVSACDPLNLSGTVLPGRRVPALPGNRLVFRSGEIAAVQSGGDIEYLAEADDNAKWEIQMLLMHRANPARFVAGKSGFLAK